MGAVSRVAVAEDDVDMRTIIADALRKDGYRVVEFGDGASLQRELAEPSDGPLALVVSDVRMPLVDGLTVLRGLRDTGSALPVVLMTAFGDEVAQKETSRLGAVLFNKPFKLAELRETVRSLLSQTGAVVA